MEYKIRIADKLLADKLEAMGAVLIEGPKACGKTRTAEQHAKSVLYMDDPLKKEQYKQTKILYQHYNCIICLIFQHHINICW